MDSGRVILDGGQSEVRASGKLIDCIHSTNCANRSGSNYSRSFVDANRETLHGAEKAHSKQIVPLPFARSV